MVVCAATCICEALPCAVQLLSHGAAAAVTLRGETWLQGPALPAEDHPPWQAWLHRSRRSAPLWKSIRSGKGQWTMDAAPHSSDHIILTARPCILSYLKSCHLARTRQIRR
jgi:hypothetical protein